MLSKKNETSFKRSFWVKNANFQKMYELLLHKIKKLYE